MGLALVAAYCYGLKPVSQKSYDSNAPYAPNDVQSDFIRKVSESCRYLCFGDTDHRVGDSDLFVYSEKISKILSGTGKKILGHEVSISKQKIYDDIDVKNPDEFLEQCRRDLVSSWQCLPEMKDNICKRQFDLFAQKKISLVALDKRRSTQSVTKSQIPLVDDVLMMPIQGSVLAQNAIYGCVDLAAPSFIPASMPAGFTGAISRWSSGLLDDQNLYNMIKEQNQPMAIVYGAGHLNKKNSDNLRAYMERHEESFYVLNLFRDEEHKKNYVGKRSDADADIIIHPSPENSSGIYVHNDALKPFLNKKTAELSRRSFFALG